MKRIDVVKKKEGWGGESDGRTVRNTTAPTKAEAVRKTADVARKDSEPVSVRIHKEDGRIQEERTYRERSGRAAPCASTSLSPSSRGGDRLPRAIHRSRGFDAQLALGDASARARNRSSRRVEHLFGDRDHLRRFASCK